MMLDITSRALPVNPNNPTEVHDTKLYSAFMVKLAKMSAGIIRQYFGTPIPTEIKADASPVTRADREAECAMREMITHTFPDHGIIGEEYGRHLPDSDYQWILDPIDGTKSFICGSITFGTLIGLTYQGMPVIGSIMLPMLDHFMIGDGHRTFLNGKPVRMRPCSQISQAILLATDHRDIEQHHNGTAFNRLVDQVRIFRMFGDCYGYYLLARGFADIMIDAIMAPWDILPLIPVIRGAGGIITDYLGRPAETGASSIAAARDIHSEIVSMLNTDLPRSSD
jgi:myo-inositol-1(or 4)-monophosphatase